MVNLQVKGVPEPVHEELRRRARERGLSMRDYVLDLLRRDQAVPTTAEWSTRLDSLRPITLGAPASELLHSERDHRLSDSDA